MSKNKSNKCDMINIKLYGWELEEMIEAYLKEKLGNVNLWTIEFSGNDLKNPHIYNDSDNIFSIYVEYKRGK